MRDSVTLAYVHDTEVSYSFHQSLVNLILFDAGEQGRIMRGGYNAVRCARSGSLADARNQAVEGFLASSPGEWLFWIDTDMGFEHDTVERLLESADETDRPIVGGLCFAQREIAQDGMHGYRTAPRFTILDWVDTPEGQRFMGRSTYPVNALVPCAGTGSACILIHRSVFERIRDEFGPTWYTQIVGDDGKLLGEDVSFCVRAGAAGIPVHVNTAVRTTHLKNVWLQEADFWEMAVPSPATERTAVIVPAMRYAHAERFMTSLRASTGMATVYAVAAGNEAEAIEAWSAAGAEILLGDGTTFAQRMNTGYRCTTEPWTFVVGDDVVFRPGWLDHAQSIAGERYHVIGTNDLGNPHVMAGEHATHMLIRRSYIDDVGASWDGPKNVCHEGYRHWFVDNEIVTAAQQRDVWAMSLGSVVEHLHPAWGKADNDDVYELGQSHAPQDRVLFEERRRTYAR
ncbi:hypothetical protein [Kribbella sp. NPDC050470]|uniref:glycosyltransferase family 2 protein n=1 Tax=unclassified Kribbella TaxID=2644121 RepID=UPI0037A95530